MVFFLTGCSRPQDMVPLGNRFFTRQERDNLLNLASKIECDNSLSKCEANRLINLVNEEDSILFFKTNKYNYSELVEILQAMVGINLASSANQDKVYLGNRAMTVAERNELLDKARAFDKNPQNLSIVDINEAIDNFPSLANSRPQTIRPRPNTKNHIPKNESNEFLDGSFNSKIRPNTK